MPIFRQTLNFACLFVAARQTCKSFFDLYEQDRQVTLQGSPDDFKIDLFAAVRNAIAHRVHDLPGNFSVSGGELDSGTQNAVGCFADDFYRCG